MFNNLTLRKPNQTDYNNLLAWENNIKNTIYTDQPVFHTKDQIQKFLNSNHDLFLNNQIKFIIQNEDSALGCIDLFDFDIVNSRAGVGIFIDEEYRNKGIAFKAINLLKIMSKEEYLINQLYTNIKSTNQKSIKVFEKSGFIRNGVKENWIRNENSFVDVFFYQIPLNKNNKVI